MILPTKRLSERRALLSLGGDIIRSLDKPKTASKLWEDVRRSRSETGPITFDWFVLALDMLYALAAIEFKGRYIARTSQ